MKADRLLHPDLLELVARAGHGDTIVLADAGLKVPEDRYAIDLAVTCGVPSMVQVVRAITTELVVENALVASEFGEWNPDVRAAVVAELPVEPEERPHADLMAEMASSALGYVKTGECSAFSSVVLVCGVSYFDEAVNLHERLEAKRS